MLTEQDIIKLYTQDKLSISKIHFIYPEIPYKKIQQTLVDNDIPIRGGRPKKTFSQEQDVFIYDALFNKKESITNIAQSMHIGTETLKNYLKIKGWSRGRVNKVNKFINENYFEVINSKEKAYWLGLLLTDGSVDKKEGRSGRIRLQLQAQDKELVEKFKESMGISSALIFDPRGNGCYSCEFTCEKIFNDLAKYDIIPNKTYKVKNIPTNISKQFLPSFLLGMFDGDGCLTYSSDLTTDVTLNFTSYSESMCNDYQNLIDNLIKKQEHNKLIHTSAWHCQWRGYRQVVNILDILYKDAPIYLERKHQKYLELKNRI